MGNWKVRTICRSCQNKWNSWTKRANCSGKIPSSWAWLSNNSKSFWSKTSNAWLGEAISWVRAFNLHRSSWNKRQGINKRDSRFKKHGFILSQHYWRARTSSFKRSWNNVTRDLKSSNWLRLKRKIFHTRNKTIHRQDQDSSRSPHQGSRKTRARLGSSD